MFIPAANLFFFFPRHTVPLDQSLQVQSWKGRTYSNKKTPSAVKHPFCYTQTSLLLTYSPHEVQTPLFFSMHLPGLPFQIQKIFHVWQGWNLIFFACNTVMAGPGMTPEETCIHILLGHRLPLQSQPKCSAFPYGHHGLCWGCKWCCNTHSRNRRKCEGGQNWARMAAVFQQLHGDLSINLWLQEPKCFDAESRWLTQG